MSRSKHDRNCGKNCRGNTHRKLNLELFVQSIKSEYTAKVYKTCLKKYFEFPESSKFIDATDTRKIEDHITDFITSMKKEGKSFSAIYNYVSSICKYYRMNRVSLDTKHIREYLPEYKKSKKDRAYQHEEIHRLLDIADERMRTVVLLLASTGMRIGAIPGLKLRNIEKVAFDAATSIYKITVYEGFKEEYIISQLQNVLLFFWIFRQGYYYIFLQNC